MHFNFFVPSPSLYYIKSPNKAAHLFIAAAKWKIMTLHHKSQSAYHDKFTNLVFPRWHQISLHVLK